MKRVTRTFTTPDPPRPEEGVKTKPFSITMQEQPRFVVSEPSQQDSLQLTAFGQDLSWLQHFSVHGSPAKPKVPVEKKDYRTVTVVCKTLGFKSDPLFVHKLPIQLKESPSVWSTLAAGPESQQEIAFLGADINDTKGLMVFADSSKPKPVGTAKWAGPQSTIGPEFGGIQSFDFLKIKNGLFAALDFNTSRLLILHVHLAYVHVDQEANTVWRSSHMVRCRKLFPKGRPTVNNNSMLMLASGQIIFLGMQTEWDFDIAQPILLNPETKIERKGFLTNVGSPSECLAVSPHGLSFYIGSKGGIITSARLDGDRARILAQICLSDKPEVRSQGSFG